MYFINADIFKNVNIYESLKLGLKWFIHLAFILLYTHNLCALAIKNLRLTFHLKSLFQHWTQTKNISILTVFCFMLTFTIAPLSYNHDSTEFNPSWQLQNGMLSSQLHQDKPWNHLRKKVRNAKLNGITANTSFQTQRGGNMLFIRFTLFSIFLLNLTELGHE